MSVTYTADVWCDADDCSQWTHGVTASTPSTKKEAREAAKRTGRFIRVGGKDYCPHCAKRLGLTEEQP